MSKHTDAARRKNCPSISQNCTSPENFKYHCVANAFLNKTIEVCAPGLFLLGFCPEYNFRGERIQDNYNADCKHYAEPCPNRYESWKFYKCKSFVTKCVILKNSIHKRESLLLNKTSIFGSVRKKINSPEFSVDNSMVLILCLGGVFMALIISAIIFIFIYRRKRRKPENCHEEEGALNPIESVKNDS